MSRLKKLDAYPKLHEDFFTRTASGGLVTIIASCCMVLLFVSELRLYLQLTTDYELNVDTTRGETIQISVRARELCARESSRASERLLSLAQTRCCALCCQRNAPCAVPANAARRTHFPLRSPSLFPLSPPRVVSSLAAGRHLPAHGLLRAQPGRDGRERRGAAGREPQRVQGAAARLGASVVLPYARARALQRRLEPDGSVHKDAPERSHVGHDEVVQVREGEDGVLLNADNTTYCGSCYGSQQYPDECCNTCADVRERYRTRGWAFSTAGTVEQCKREGLMESIALQAGEGCQVFGHFEVNKVAGNFHFAPGKSFQQGNMHVHDLMAFGLDAYFNMSHVVNKARHLARRRPRPHSAQLAFGEDYPGLVNPLDGAAVYQTGPHLMYQYFVKVVPTAYVDIKGKTTRTAQFSVMEHPKCGRGARGRWRGRALTSRRPGAWTS